MKWEISAVETLHLLFNRLDLILKNKDNNEIRANTNKIKFVKIFIESKTFTSLEAKFSTK